MKRLFFLVLVCFGYQFFLFSMSQDCQEDFSALKKITLPSKEILEGEFQKIPSYGVIKNSGMIEEFAEKEFFVICFIPVLISFVHNYEKSLVFAHGVENLNVMLSISHLELSLDSIKRVFLKTHPEIIKKFEELGLIGKM